jgi:hypothetical protein
VVLFAKRRDDRSARASRRGTIAAPASEIMS